MLQNQPALIVTAMKNEGPYILEWVAHHMAIGFDSFIVVTNDCTDYSDLLLDRLEKLIALKHVPNPKSLFPEKENWQVMAHRYASLFQLYQDAGWIYFTDVDEFLQIWVGNGNLDDFWDATDGFDVVSFTSMPFSSSGVIKIVDAPTVSQFTIQSKTYNTGQRHRNAIKSMFHNRIKFTVRRNHRPRRADFSTTGYKWVDGSGRVFEPAFLDGKQKDIDPAGSVDFAQFNHYAIRSAEAYLMKMDRGDTVGAPRLSGERRLQYWAGYDNRGDEDLRASTPSPEAKRILEDFLGDPELAELHAKSVDHHQTRAKKLRQDPEFAEILEGMGVATARA